MRSKFILSFIVALPLVTAAACSDDTTSDDSNAGSGNIAGSGAGRGGSGGAAGRGGSPAGGASAGRGGEVSVGDAGTGPAEGGTTSAGAAGETADDAGAGGATDMALTDGQTLKVLATVNQGEIAAAQTALAAAQAASVLDFAQMMVTEHSAANAKVLGLVGTDHIAPAPSDVSAKLEAESAALLVQLSTTSATSFDKVYMQSQVAAHQEVLTLIDTRLAPGVTNADLKALLESTRTSVMTHLVHAESVLAAL